MKMSPAAVRLSLAAINDPAHEHDRLAAARTDLRERMMAAGLVQRIEGREGDRYALTDLARTEVGPGPVNAVGRDLGVRMQPSDRPGVRSESRTLFWVTGAGVRAGWRRVCRMDDGTWVLAFEPVVAPSTPRDHAAVGDHLLVAGQVRRVTARTRAVLDPTLWPSAGVGGDRAEGVTASGRPFVLTRWGCVVTQTVTQRTGDETRTVVARSFVRARTTFSDALAELRPGARPAE
ncbi:hypothetical protein [Micromonospora sp. WMMC273]|uniref:hypothetical protein n=1 Tax=Micromonospora sp. WMMC273 TaxID=3015157 RepID=UPI0022B6E25B|nr:hypothetical protein [Micromonospora sp. WMMC273]MCZ7478856.1 hypothetical protein [Micromonospora sp. WMMC273]